MFCVCVFRTRFGFSLTIQIIGKYNREITISRQNIKKKVIQLIISSKKFGSRLGLIPHYGSRCSHNFACKRTFNHVWELFQWKVPVT